MAEAPAQHPAPLPATVADVMQPPVTTVNQNDHAAAAAYLMKRGRDRPHRHPGAHRRASDVTYHQFVLRVDGEGGFAVTEGDDPAAAARDIAKFAPFLKYTVYPVLDVAEAAGILAEAVEWRKSITQASDLVLQS